MLTNSPRHTHIRGPGPGHLKNPSRAETGRLGWIKKTGQLSSGFFFCQKENLSVEKIWRASLRGQKARLLAGCGEPSGGERYGAAPSQPRARKERAVKHTV
jgi:hypothetical protein